MKKVLFIDRDGTLVIEPKDNYQIDSLEKLEFYPEVFQYLSKIVKELDYILVMVTNQDGLGTESFPEDSFWPSQNKLIQAFKNEGIIFAEVFIDRSFPFENSSNRKPGTGMLTHYIKGDYNLADSWVIGDRITDVELAVNLGSKSIYMGIESCEKASYSTQNWEEIYQILKKQVRKSTIIRKTHETDITIQLVIEGKGKSNIKTGLGFLDHMLEQIARHGSFDLEIEVKGDLHVDEHHTIEDTGIALGQAFLQALGSKKGIERYGFLLPMDDCLAQIALDFGGRPWLVWQVDFKWEKIGDVPTEMFYHFFKSFCDNALCNLNIKAEGINEHHRIEAVFKAFAKALKMAVTQNESFIIPSTKGSL